MISLFRQIRRACPYLSAVALLATFARGGEPEKNPVPPHPLVTAAERLYQRSFPQACDELVHLASVAPGLTDDDFILLHFLTALRAFDDGNNLAAQRAVSQALQVDRSAALPPFASQLRKMLEETRARLPPETESRDQASRLREAGKAASQREPAHQALLRAVDTLYERLQIEGAADVLDFARSWAPTSASDQTELALRQGVLRMEVADEGAARAAFREALEAAPGPSLPGYAPPKTIRMFEEVKREFTAQLKTRTPVARPVGPLVSQASPPPIRNSGNLLVDGSRPWGLATGGAGLALVAGGALSGVIALSSLHAEERASMEGDYAAYTQNHDAAVRARNVANGLYGAGAVALGVGAYLFFRAPGEASVGAGIGGGKAWLMIGGHF